MAEGSVKPSGVCIPSNLWNGKTPKKVLDAMRHEDFSDDIIARVLHEWCGVTNKTEIGRLLGKPDKESGTYTRIANRLLKKSALLELKSVDAPVKRLSNA